MDYSDPDKIRRYIEWTSRQTNYSAFNRALIHQQMPNATMVGAKGFWRNLGRWPNHGKYYLDDMDPAEIRNIIDSHNGLRNGIHAFIKKNGQPAAYRKGRPPRRWEDLQLHEQEARIEEFSDVPF